MAFDRDIVIAPVTLAEIRSLLEVSTDDLSTLCTSNKINKWSKYKPVRNNKVEPLTVSGNVDEFKDSTMGSAGIDPNYGFGDRYGSYSGTVQYSQNDIFSTQSGYFFNDKEIPYLRPRGEVSGSYDEQYRLTDFIGYYHIAPPPMFYDKVLDANEDYQFSYCLHYNVDEDYELVDCINCVALNKPNSITMTYGGRHSDWKSNYCLHLDDFMANGAWYYSIAVILVDKTDGGYMFINTAKTVATLSGHKEYRQVVPQTGDNPSANGWYEKTGPYTYVLTTDTSVNPEKTYYELNNDTPIPSGPDIIKGMTYDDYNSMCDNRFPSGSTRYVVFEASYTTQTALTIRFDAYYVNRAWLRIKGFNPTSSNIHSNSFFKDGHEYWSTTVLFPFNGNDVRPAGIYIPTGGYRVNDDQTLAQGSGVSLQDCYSFAVCNKNMFSLECKNVNTIQ